MTIIHNEDFERAIIGNILTDNSTLRQCINTGLRADNFYSANLKNAYSLMLKMYNEGTNIDIYTLRARAEKDNKDIDITDISKCTSYAISDNINEYSKALQELCTKRNIVSIVEEMTESINTLTNENISEYAEIIKGIADSKSDSRKAVRRVSEIMQEEQSDFKFNTGFKQLDTKIDGLKGGTLTVMSGDSGAGKSTFINQIICNAVEQGIKTFIYSGELQNYELLNWLFRTIAKESDLKECKSSTGAILYKVNGFANQQITQYLDDKLYIYSDSEKNNLRNIINRIEYLSEYNNVRFFIIDNMMSLNADSKDLYDKQREIAFKLKDVAKRLNVAIILVAHNRKNKEGKEAGMYDIAGASEVANYSDNIIIISRTDKENEEGDSITNIKISKCRGTGRTTREPISIMYNTKRKRFYEMFNNELDYRYSYDKIEQMKM